MVVALRAVRVLLPWEVFSTHALALAKQTGLPWGALIVMGSRRAGSRSRGEDWTALWFDQPVLRSPAAIPLMEM